MRVLDHKQHGGPLRGEEDAICERAQGQFLALQSGKIGQFGAVAQIERKELVIDRPDIGRGFSISRDAGGRAFRRASPHRHPQRGQPSGSAAG